MKPTLPSHINRFRIIDLLGQGAQGSVFLALDPTSNRHVALKVLSEGSSTGIARARFLREFTSIARLSHPAIVAVYEQGEWKARPFFVMEYIAGTTIARHAVTLRRDPAAICRIMTIVADGLAYTHSRGVIHRDLKPANILVDRDGTPRISDFGIAKPIQESVNLTQTSSIVGTMNYISPEILRNDQIDPRSDLYSFGVILYELLTGELPFQSDSMIHLAMMHLTHPPPRLADRVKDCPAPLDDLLRKLLAKDPWERPATAELAARSLQSIADDLDRSTPPAPSRSPTHGPPLVSRFTGRDHESDFLAGSIPETGFVPFAIRIIRGMGGTGKSRLVREALNRINRKDIRIVELPSAPIGSLPFESLQELFSVMTETLERSPDLMTELQDSLRDLPLISAHFKRVSPACSSSPEEREKTNFRKLFRALARILARLSAQTPWVIVIEDIQNADQAGLNLIDTLMTSAEINDFQCVWWFSVRIEDTIDSSAFAKWFSSRERPDRIRSLELAPLSFSESCKLVSSMIHQPEQSPDCMRLVSYGQGFPLILVETVRSFAHRGHLMPCADHWRFTEPQTESDTLIPISLRDVLKTRLDHLDPETLETLCWAALLDPEIDFLLLRHLDEGPDDHILMRLDRLITQRFIEPYSNGQREYYRFCHQQLRDLLIEMMGERDTMSRHRDIAMVLQTLPEPGASSYRIARHLEAARQWTEAIRYWGQACCEADAAKQELSAVEFGARAEAIIEKHGDELPRVAQRLRLAYLFAYYRSLYNRNEFTRFLDLSAATETFLLPALPMAQQLEMMRQRIIAFYMTGEIAKGDHESRRVQDQFPPQDAQKAILSGNIYRGLSLSDPHASFSALMKLKRHQRSTGQQEAFKWNPFMVAYTLHRLKRHAVSERIFRATIEQAIRDRNSDLQASCLSGLGALLINCGRERDGEAYIREALDIHRRLGDDYWISCNLHDLALIAQSEGRYHEARPLMEESLEFSLLRRLPRESAISLENLSRLYLRVGDYGAILRCVERHDSVFPDYPETVSQVSFRARHAMALMLTGDLGRATAELRKAFRCQLLEKSGDKVMLMSLLVLWSECLRIKGHNRAAARSNKKLLSRSDPQHTEVIFSVLLGELNDTLTRNHQTGISNTLETIAALCVKPAETENLGRILSRFRSLAHAFIRKDPSIALPWEESPRHFLETEGLWHRASAWCFGELNRFEEAQTAGLNRQSVRRLVGESLPEDRREFYFSHDVFTPEWM